MLMSHSLIGMVLMKFFASQIYESCTNDGKGDPLSNERDRVNVRGFIFSLNFSAETL